MSQSYVKECIYCKTKIRMSDQKEGKWLPYNQNGSQHDCKKKNGTKQEITLEMVIKKLESIGIKVDLAELFKERAI